MSRREVNSKNSNQGSPNNTIIRKYPSKAANGRQSPIQGYIGLTLKEYFKLPNHNHELEEIDQESCSSKEAQTPSFGCNHPSRQSRRQSRNFNRKHKIKTEIDQIKDIHLTKHSNLCNLTTLNSDQLISMSKYSIKLPFIKVEKNTGPNKQSSKDVKNLEANLKNSKQLINNHISEPKSQEILKSSNIKQNSQTKNLTHHRANFSLRSRITSTSFYNMNSKEERLKTEEEKDCKESQNYLKSFTITRYAASKSKPKEV